jgi:hypothetical protein
MAGKVKKYQKGDIHTCSFALVDFTMSEKIENSTTYLVVPVVMMREGVHNGSGGHGFYSAEALAETPSDWDGFPVVVNHPTEDGQYISAASEDVVKVGKIVNAHYDDGLKAEAWLDVKQLEAVSPTTLAKIRQGHPIDVSIGSFNAVSYTEGEWNDEVYEYTVEHILPDHLALLPDEQGACSWEDGCGVRVNKKGGNMKKEQLEVFQELNQQGLAVTPIVNQQGFHQILELLFNEVQKMNAEDVYHYVEEVYDEFFVYRKRIYDGGGETLYRQDYSIDAEDNLVLNGLPVEVKRKVTYETMQMRRTTPINNSNKGGTKMSDEKKPCCEAKVDALIANEHSKFEAKDREWLLELNEKQLEKLTPSEPEIKANAEEAIKTFKSTLKSLDDYIDLMPEMMANQVKEGVKAYKAKRDALVKSITDNSEFSEDEVKDFTDEVLEKMSKSLTKDEQDFSGQGNPPAVNTGGDEEPMYPVGIEFDK